MVTTELGACEWFVWDLRRSNLIDRNELDLVVQEFLLAHAGAEPPALADHLVQQGLLTGFQCERLLQGKTQGFILGPFTLLDVLGTGSLGTVYKARSKADNTNYAVKVLPRRSMWNVRIARRKVKSFELCKHPAVLPFVDVGTSGGMHYLAWPFIEGHTLEQEIADKGPLEPGEVARIASEVAEGLASCHPHGLTHGLLKPSNLMLTDDGHVRILDFGIGCLLAEADGESIVDTMSNANSVNSGLDCASPESIMDPSNISPSGDQYSLGCIMYYCLSGRYPFPDGSAVEKMMAHQTKQPMPLLQLNPELPEGLVVVIERMMAKKPEDRFPDAADVASALSEYVAEGGAAAARHHPSTKAADRARHVVEPDRHPVLTSRESGKRPALGSRDTVQNTSCPTPMSSARVQPLPKPDVKFSLPTRQSIKGTSAHPPVPAANASSRPAPAPASGERKSIGTFGLTMLMLLAGAIGWLLARKFFP